MSTIMTISEKDFKKKNPKVKINPHLSAISKLLKSKKLKAIKLTKKGQYDQLSAGVEISWSPKNQKDWFLSFLFVPNTKNHEHFHLDIDLKTAKKLQKLITKILSTSKKMSKKPKKKK